MKCTICKGHIPKERVWHSHYCSPRCRDDAKVARRELRKALRTMRKCLDTLDRFDHINPS
jgi:hypothetical protein